MYNYKVITLIAVLKHTTYENENSDICINSVGELREAILFSINTDQVPMKSVTMLLHNSMALFTSVKYGAASDMNTL